MCQITLTERDVRLLPSHNPLTVNGTSLMNMLNDRKNEFITQVAAERKQGIAREHSNLMKGLRTEIHTAIME